MTADRPAVSSAIRRAVARKKESRNKADPDKGSRADADESTAADVRPTEIDLDLDDEGADDVSTLVAEIAHLAEDTTEASEGVATVSHAQPPEGGIRVERLDAVRDDEAESTSTAPPAAEREGLEGAIDLGDASSPELRARLLQQTLLHVEKQDARYRVPFADSRKTGRRKGAIAVLFFLGATVLAVAPPAWLRPEPPAQIDAATRTRDIRKALLLQAQQIDAYRVSRQRLPDTLEDLPGRVPGVRYVRSSSRLYQLIAYAPDGHAVVYDSSNPAPEFDRLAARWLTGASP